MCVHDYCLPCFAWALLPGYRQEEKRRQSTNGPGAGKQGMDRGSDREHTGSDRQPEPLSNPDQLSEALMAAKKKAKSTYANAPYNPAAAAPEDAGSGMFDTPEKGNRRGSGRGNDGGGGFGDGRAGEGVGGGSGGRWGDERGGGGHP